jgi:hypothetical protein
MTALHSAVKKRNRNKQFVAMVVEPSEEFVPSNWQDTPKAYRIVELAGNMKHRGDADAWRFLFNRDVMKVGPVDRWAIWVS